MPMLDEVTHSRRGKRRPLALVTLLLAALLLSACSAISTEMDGGQPVVQAAEVHLAQPGVEPGAGGNMEVVDHSPAEHTAGINLVPARAAATANPVLTSDESIERGAITFARNCAICHGKSGKGDGPSAAALEPKPANLHAGYVQNKTDGALFWIISHGRENTAMPPWDNLLSEEDRWHLVNFLRTLPRATNGP